MGRADHHSSQARLPQTQAEDFDPDRSLFEALQAGDEEILPELIQRHGRWVRGVIFSILGNRAEVDDVYQQVWVAVWRRCQSLEDSSRWRHWLYRMAHNAAIDATRRAKRQRGLWSRLVGRTPHLEGSGSPTQKRLIIKEEYQRALSAIHGMPEIYREPFVLRHLEGWTYRQIGQALGLPEDTVETRLVRARRLLRELLVERK
jgi:RNA polymerase sigma-70 factor, ECF subfamily